METPTTRDLLKSLASNICPACGARKHNKQTFCRACYYRLPRDARQDLYRRVGYGYEQAVAAALRALGAEDFHTTLADC